MAHEIGFDPASKLLELIGKKKDNSDLPPYTSVFFQPYQSKSDAYYRAADIVTAPFKYIGYALGTLFFCFNSFIKSIFNLNNQPKAKGYLIESGSFLLAFLTSALLAVLSPLINTIDFIGGGIMTLKQKSDNTSYQALNPAPTA